MINVVEFMFENSPFTPFWSAILAGYAVVVGGGVYLTPAGEAYLERVSFISSTELCEGV